MRIGFIAGCFDRLHEGHLHILREAKKHCDKLYVGLNLNKYIIEKKGRQPLSWDKRSLALQKTYLVQAVLPFYANPIDLILMLKPDVIFCGSDYKIEDIIGYGLAEVVIIERLPNISSTELTKQNKLLWQINDFLLREP